VKEYILGSLGGRQRGGMPAIRTVEKEIPQGSDLDSTVKIK
jgi:hypothetical protein